MNKCKGGPRPTSAGRCAKTTSPLAGNKSGAGTKVTKATLSSTAANASQNGSAKMTPAAAAVAKTTHPCDVPVTTGECVAKAATQPCNAAHTTVAVATPGDAAAVMPTTSGDKVEKTKCIYQRAFDMHVRNPLSDKCRVYTRYYLVQRIPPARRTKNSFAACPSVEYDSTFFQSLAPRRTYYVIHPDFSSERCAVNQMKRTEQQVVRLANGGRVPFQQCHLDADTVAIPVLPPCACPSPPHLPSLSHHHPAVASLQHPDHGISCKCERASCGKYHQQSMQGATPSGDQVSFDCCGELATMVPAEMVVPMQRKWLGGPMMTREYTNANCPPSNCEMLNTRRPLLPIASLPTAGFPNNVKDSITTKVKDETGNCSNKMPPSSSSSHDANAASSNKCTKCCQNIV